MTSVRESTGSSALGGQQGRRPSGANSEDSIRGRTVGTAFLKTLAGICIICDRMHKLGGRRIRLLSLNLHTQAQNWVRMMDTLLRFLVVQKLPKRRAQVGPWLPGDGFREKVLFAI